MTSATPDHPGYQALTFATALGCGLVAGIFLAFSSFVMSGLARLPAAEGIAAMQSINITAVRPVFMATLFGTAVATLPLIVFGIWHRDESPGLLLVLGGLLYLIGAIGLTVVYHQPHNLALGELAPTSAGAAAQWHDYVVGWTRWNHVRTVSSLGATAAYMLALLRF